MHIQEHVNVFEGWPAREHTSSNAELSTLNQKS